MTPPVPTLEYKPCGRGCCLGVRCAACLEPLGTFIAAQVGGEDLLRNALALGHSPRCAGPSAARPPVAVVDIEIHGGRPLGLHQLLEILAGREPKAEPGSFADLTRHHRDTMARTIDAGSTLLHALRQDPGNQQARKELEHNRAALADLIVMGNKIAGDHPLESSAMLTWLKDCGPKLEECRELVAAAIKEADQRVAGAPNSLPAVTGRLSNGDTAQGDLQQLVADVDAERATGIRAMVELCRGTKAPADVVAKAEAHGRRMEALLTRSTGLIGRAVTPEELATVRMLTGQLNGLLSCINEALYADARMVPGPTAAAPA